MSGQGFTTAILLADGGSSRLGRPKQLLAWNGTNLLDSTMRRLAVAGCERLIVVLGAYESEVREQCRAPARVKLNIVTNANWRKGQATSLRVGMEYAVALKDIGATVIALCVQPLIDLSHYRELISRINRLGYFAAAREYPEGLGVPACVSLSALQSLATSGGDNGAKKWRREQSPPTVGRVRCPAAAMDIDTELDYRERLNHG